MFTVFIHITTILISSYFTLQNNCIQFPQIWHWSSGWHCIPVLHLFWNSIFMMLSSPGMQDRCFSAVLSPRPVAFRPPLDGLGLKGLLASLYSWLPFRCWALGPEFFFWENSDSVRLQLTPKVTVPADSGWPFGMPWTDSGEPDRCDLCSLMSQGHTQSREQEAALTWLTQPRKASWRKQCLRWILKGQ